MINRDYCQHGPRGEFSCDNPTRYVARKELSSCVSVFACGKHIAGALATDTEGRWVVVVTP